MRATAAAASAAVEKFLSDAGVRRAVTAGGRKQTETKAHAVREREQSERGNKPLAGCAEPSMLAIFDIGRAARRQRR